MSTARKRTHGRSLRTPTMTLVLALLLALSAALLLAGAALAADTAGRAKSAKPGKPTATSPKGTVTLTTPGQSTGPQAKPTFKWKKASGAAKYELRVSAGSKLLLKKTGLKKTTWTSTKALPTNVDLSWKVRASNARGSGAWSKSLKFRMVPPVVPPVPAPATPTFSPPAGALAWGTTVTISSAGAEAIYYTTNGDTPTRSSTNQATTPLVINSAVTVKALAVKAGATDSAIGSAAYTQAATADLSGLALSGSPVNYAFAPATYTYSGVTVSNAVAGITVTPTGSGTITVEGTVVASGSPSATIALTAGVAKTITVVATESGKSGKTYSVAVTRNVALAMVPVPAGTFQRDGSSANTSTVSAFSMSETEVTVDQFTAVTGLANPSTEFTDVVNGPVQMTTWYHALVFCNKLSMREGLTPVYTIGGSTDPADWIAANGGIVPITSNATWDAAIPNWGAGGYRLPTEMEWMWAAMGATSGSGYTSPTYLTGYGKLFAGSNATNAAGDNGTNAIGDYVWYGVNAGTTTHPVGTKMANELGLYDMSGNVWEWCWDWCADYPSGALPDYHGAASGTHRVGRGGSWGDYAPWWAVAARSWYVPYDRYHNYGFRVVRL